MASSLSIVIVASELPYPPTAGNRIRTLNLALRLASRHRITFIAHRGDESSEATRHLPRTASRQSWSTGSSP